MTKIVRDIETTGRLKVLNDGPYIIVMCGLPGAGKSTIRSMIDANAVQLSTDDYVDQLAAATGKTYDELWGDFINEATTAVNRVFRAAISQRENIIWDQTNLSAKKRRKILSQVPKEYTKIALYVECHEDLRQKRLTQRPGKNIPAHIDQNMINSLEIPTEDEGFDEVKIIVSGPPHTGKEKSSL